MNSRQAILIAGPTASGKSALAMELAAKHGGAIINADSMQVYRELRILTARPSLEDEAACPHLLYGFVPGVEAYSAGRYARDAAAAIAACREAGQVPIIVGGTGLYFGALLRGLSPIPAVPDEVRQRWRLTAQQVAPADLHRMLAERDPLMADRLRPSDPQRVTRALEVLEATGRSLASWQTQPGDAIIPEADCERFVVLPDRETLYARCDRRFDDMLAGGALGEVEALLALGLDPGLPIMRALGVRPLGDLLRGDLTKEEAADAGKRETRNYAKRQLTWLRRNMRSWSTVHA